MMKKLGSLMVLILNDINFVLAELRMDGTLPRLEAEYLRVKPSKQQAEK